MCRVLARVFGICWCPDCCCTDWSGTAPVHYSLFFVVPFVKNGLDEKNNTYYAWVPETWALRLTVRTFEIETL